VGKTKIQTRTQAEKGPGTVFHKSMNTVEILTN